MKTEEPWKVLLVVRADPGVLTENKTRRMHYHARARLVKVHRDLGRMAWVNAGKPRAPEHRRIVVSANLGRLRELDEANAWQGMKAMMDGFLVDAITPDDGPRFVRLGLLRQFRSRDAVVFFELKVDSMGGL